VKGKPIMDQVPPNKKDFVVLQQELLHEQLAAAWQLHIERVEEQLRNGWQVHLGRIVEERFAEFSTRFEHEVRESSERLAAEHEQAVATQERLRWSSQLSQIARRLDLAADLPAWTSALLDGAAAVAPRVALFSLLAGEVKFEGARLAGGETYPGLTGLALPLESAQALKAAADSLDTVISLASVRELSQPLFSALRLADGERVALLPVVTERTGKARCAAAMLVIPQSEPAGDLPALELLAAIAGLSLDLRRTGQKASKLGAGEMLGIRANTEPKMPVSVVPDVTKLPRDEQELHARAQRFARVRVAEMRLYQAQAVKDGREKRNLYGAVRKEVDQGREQFRQEFLSTPTMIDYLHVELVRTLANDDASLLGPDYPGPLV
jgi:hypothetical protein